MGLMEDPEGDFAAVIVSTSSGVLSESQSWSPSSRQWPPTNQEQVRSGGAVAE